jgi:5-oxoprolinase (ATP-hydrolysing) subunit A
VTIDLNADVGEGVPGDEALLVYVTSVNIACGFHAGDAETMRRLSGLAAERGVAIGAHVGYRDPEGLGRRPLDVPAKIIESETAEQISALQECAAHEGARVRYVKPHGALYTRATRDRACAEAIARASRRAGGIKAMLGLPGSELLVCAKKARLSPVTEGFADRGYRDDGSLVPRGDPNALRGEEDAVRQGMQIAIDRSVVTVDGKRIMVPVDSICIHGDAPAAESVARRLVDELRAAGIQPKPFV